MTLYKFEKPTSCVPYDDDDIQLANRFNLIGSDSWDKKISDRVGLVNGDITKRKNLKDKIKRSLKNAQGNHCYYCGASFELFKNINRNIHIDHILPKNAKHGRYGKFVFEARNLILACPICNGTDLKGIKDFAVNRAVRYDRIKFSIVHPYNEDIAEHLSIDQSSGVVILINEDERKGKMMRDVFRLNDAAAIRARLGDILVRQKEIDDNRRAAVSEIITSIPNTGRVVN